jgi:hypothetical protein
MPLAGFEPTIPVFKRAKTFHALDHSATVTGFFQHYPLPNPFQFVIYQSSYHLILYSVSYSAVKQPRKRLQVASRRLSAARNVAVTAALEFGHRHLVEVQTFRSTLQLPSSW